MATPRVGIFPTADRQAIIDAARKLKLDPYEFGAFLSLEAGPNMDPNIVGGAGNRHRGLIQFGPNEQKLYGITGNQTRAQQIPAVLQYFQDRGYKPGMGIERAYATVLGGNPNVSLNAEDSFGTSVAKVSKRFKPGGDYYQNAVRVLGDVGPATSPVATTSAKPKPEQQELAGQKPLLLRFAQELFSPILTPGTTSGTTNTLSQFMNLLGTMGQ